LLPGNAVLCRHYKNKTDSHQLQTETEVIFNKTTYSNSKLKTMVILKTKLDFNKPFHTHTPSLLTLCYSSYVNGSIRCLRPSWYISILEVNGEKVQLTGKVKFHSCW